MVEWKGDISEESGVKAERLDKLDGFNVPNFFVITPEDISELFNGNKDSERILNTSIDQRARENIKEAYEDVGMSSEVRKASGKAKSLVGGQRNNQLVSIRVSDSGREKYTYKLNVGLSNFFDALKEVVSSYCSKESDYPAIIVQKMVEPGYTGALENHGRFSIVETVQGLGISLEEGLTEPSTYVLSQGRIEDVFMPEEQLEISRNPVHGDNQRKKVEVDERPFKSSEIQSLARKASRMGVNIKFVYKRGSFHIVDVYEPVNDGRPVITGEGIRASKGEIKGRVGRNVSFSDQTLPPEDFQDALIAGKGGYTSRDGYRIRQSGKPAIFQFNGELQQGTSVDVGAEEVNIESSSASTERPRGRSEEREVNPFKQDSGSEKATIASEVLPVDPRIGKGICIDRNSDQGYVLTDRETSATRIPESGYVSSYEDFFTFEGDRAIVDTRSISAEGLERAFEYMEAELKILVMAEPRPEIVRPAVQNGFEVFGVAEEHIEGLSELLASEEKKFIMDRLRNLE
ncbi:hypothetical protein ACK3SF_00150 [Candidatus Nanosalina sp. VS9-1]|uniref:hypothetical protein n=1 Tax=Candidatus Nanosalina sp. VS9-1 TaxID=3388566 RepID=UPI0039E1E704